MKIASVINYGGGDTFRTELLVFFEDGFYRAVGHVAVVFGDDLKRLRAWKGPGRPHPACRCCALPCILQPFRRRPASVLPSSHICQATS